MGEDLKWGHDLEYIFSVIGYAVGYGSVWRFPFYLFTYGGAAFLIPYIVSLLTIGIPLFMLENAVGQVLGTPIRSYTAVNYRFKGIAAAGAVISFLTTLYYIVLLAWSSVFLVHSFYSPLPWTQNTHGKPYNETYFEDEIINSSGSINELGCLQWSVVLGLLFSWTLCYFCIWKGIKSSGKVVYVTAPMPYIFLIALLIRGITLEGASKGLYFMIDFKLEDLLSVTPWKMAGNQILFSMGVGVGGMTLYSSFRDKHRDVVKPSIYLPLLNSFTALFACVTIFSYIGHMAHEANIDVGDLPLEGPKLAFIAYPNALTLMPGSNFWAVCFFLMLISLGIDSQFAMIEIYIHYCEEERYLKWRREVNSAIFIGISFLISLIFACQAGHYILELVDRYIYSLSIYILIILEAVIWGYIYKIEKLDLEILKYTSKSLPMWVQFTLKYITPVWSVGLLIMAIEEIFVPIEGFPRWTMLIGWFLILITIAPLLYYALKRTYSLRTIEIRENEDPGSQSDNAPKIISESEMVDIQIIREGEKY